MSFESAAGPVPAPIEVTGLPRPLVTDDGNVVVELPLSGVPGELWLSYLRQRVAPSEPPDNVGWIQYRRSAEGAPTISFRLVSGEPNDLVEACQSVERLVDRASDDWRNDETVVDAVDNQQWINDLQLRLNQTAQVYSRR